MNINKAYWHTRQIKEFDVDAYIDEIVEKYKRLSQEDPGFFGGIVRDRESLRKMWDDSMDMPPQGDDSLYPNKDGRHEPALMDVWHKSGDFWRAKYRKGDTLYCDQDGLPLWPWMIDAIRDTEFSEIPAPAERKFVELDLFA